MPNGYAQTYKFCSGLGDDNHLKEINALAGQGYRIAHMIFAPAGELNNKPVVVLMELTNAPDSHEYSR